MWKNGFLVDNTTITSSNLVWIQSTQPLRYMLIRADFPLAISRQINFSELPSAAGPAIAQLLQPTAAL